jgi:hypothetical protein
MARNNRNNISMIALSNSIKAQSHRAYLAGKRVTEIAGEFGLKRSTVSQWVSRGGWAKERERIVNRTTLAISHKATKVTVNAIARHQERIQRVVDGKLDTLDQIRVKKTASIGEIARALATLDKVQRRNLGLDTAEGSTPKRTIHFHLGAAMPQPMIEVTPECSSESTEEKKGLSLTTT